MDNRPVFYTICPCSNCRENVWRYDDYEAYRTRGYVKRYSCFKCGEDLFLDRVQPARKLEPQQLLEIA